MLDEIHAPLPVVWARSTDMLTSNDAGCGDDCVADTLWTSVLRDTG